ncbi:MAG: flagellar motor switch protein FliM [Oscillospiraceae bacterium]|nr:flagellar motor switch protein FliM [Oscillospiraceae bacterium]
MSDEILSSDVLSSDEISDILGAMKRQDAPSARTAKKTHIVAHSYDFRTADRFPKEQKRTIQIIFDSFATLFSNQMATVARGSVECEAHEVYETTFANYISALESPMCMAVFKAPPMAGSQLLTFSPQASYMFINRLLGGAFPHKNATKQFTEIELKLIERIIHDVAGVYEEAWEKVIRLKFQHERIETSSQFVQIAQGSESVAVIELDVRIGNESGGISFCLPHSVIEPISKSLNTRMWYESATSAVETAAENTEQIRERLYRTSVPMTASFNETSATVDDVLSLAPGDLIQLNHKATEPVIVSIAHIPKFRASLGEHNHRRALRLTEILKTEKSDKENKL